MQNNIKKIDNNQGTHLAVMGGNYRIIISGKQTDDAFAMIEMQIPAGSGPGPHAHASFQETFYVLEGEVEFKTLDGKSIAKTGDVITIPKGGAVHGFKNISSNMARLLCTVVPAGLDEFFEEVGTPVHAGEFLPPPRLSEDAVKKLMAIAG